MEGKQLYEKLAHGSIMFKGRENAVVRLLLLCPQKRKQKAEWPLGVCHRAWTWKVEQGGEYRHRIRALSILVQAMAHQAMHRVHVGVNSKAVEYVAKAKEAYMAVSDCVHVNMCFH